MEEKLTIKKGHRKLSKGEIIKRLIFITIGSVLMGIGLELFLVPNKLLDGGIVGIAIKIGRASVGKECRSRWSPYH